MRVVQKVSHEARPLRSLWYAMSTLKTLQNFVKIAQTKQCVVKGL